MKVAIVSWTPQVVRKQLKAAGLKESKKPDIVIAFGGEGTFLFAEQTYPGIPKLLIRHNRACARNHDLSKLLSALKAKQYRITKIPKLSAYLNARKVLTAMNDINVHYYPPTALRFEVRTGKFCTGQVIGDGIVIATPYGSSAYYKSITGKTFKNGIGVAFNNPTKRLKHINLPLNAKIEIRILRGPGLLAADCNKKVFKLKSGDRVRIKKDGYAKIINLKNLPLKIPCP